MTHTQLNSVNYSLFSATYHTAKIM